MTQPHENQGEIETRQSAETVVEFILRLWKKMKFIFIREPVKFRGHKDDYLCRN